MSTPITNHFASSPKSSTPPSPDNRNTVFDPLFRHHSNRSNNTRSQVLQALRTVLEASPPLAQHLDQCVTANPVLSIGLAAALSGRALIAMQPFEGAALLSASTYLIAQSLNPVIQQLAQWVHVSANDASTGLTVDNAKEILDVLQKNHPYAHLAIKEIIAHSSLVKALHPDGLTQLFRAKTAHQLPEAEQVLKALNLPIGNTEEQTGAQIQPKAVHALATLIDRQIPALTTNTMAYFEQTGNPENPLTQDHEALGKLLTFIHTLISHPAAHTQEFWQYKFNAETLHSLDAFDQESHSYLSQLLALRNNLEKQVTNNPSSRQGKEFADLQQKASHIGGLLRSVRDWTSKAREFLMLYEGQPIHFTEELKNDKMFMLAVITLRSGELLSAASPELQNDRDIVMAAVQQEGPALEFASTNFRANPEVVLAAVKQNGCALEFASQALRANPTIVLAAVSNDGGALAFASENLRANSTVVLEAVKQTGEALQYASEDLRANSTVVLEAVKQEGRALQYASEDLRDNSEIVLEAVKQEGKALQYASTNLRTNKEVVLAALKQNESALQYAGEDFHADRKIVLAAVQKNGWALQFASQDLRNDREIVLAVVQQNGWALQFASQDLRADREIVLTAVKQEGSGHQFAHADLQNDPEIRRMAGWIN